MYYKICDMSFDDLYKKKKLNYFSLKDSKYLFGNIFIIIIIICRVIRTIIYFFFFGNDTKIIGFETAIMYRTMTTRHVSDIRKLIYCIRIILNILYLHTKYLYLYSSRFLRNSVD